MRLAPPVTRLHAQNDQIASYSASSAKGMSMKFKKSDSSPLSSLSAMMIGLHVHIKKTTQAILISVLHLSIPCQKMFQGSCTFLFLPYLSLHRRPDDLTDPLETFKNWTSPESFPGVPYTGAISSYSSALASPCSSRSDPVS